MSILYKINIDEMVVFYLLDLLPEGVGLGVDVDLDHGGLYDGDQGLVPGDQTLEPLLLRQPVRVSPGNI